MKIGNAKIGPACRRAAQAAALALVGLTAACGSDAEPTIACFPEEARKWIYQLDTEGGEDYDRSRAVSAERATFYFDRSVSMIGYLQGADNDNRPLHILADNLPDIARRAGADHQYIHFGTSLAEPTQNAGSTLTDPDFYLDCRNGVGESCDSNLRVVFEQIAETPDELAVVVTDLWYEEGGAERQGSVRLQDALTRILEDNRAITLYGIDAPFSGRIYDIPTGGDSTGSVDHRGTHPLYVMVVGQKADVVEFDRQMAATVGLLQTGLESGEIHRTIFTIDPGPLRPVREDPVSPGNDPGMMPAVFETYPGLGVQQFRMDVSRSARREAPANVRAPSWIAPREDDFLPNTLHEGPLLANVRVWERRDADDQCSEWRPAGELVEGERFDPQPGGPEHYTFAFNRENVGSRIRRPGVYLVVGELERLSVARDNEATLWTEAWSVPARSAGGLARGAANGGQFPTLNLSQFVSIMENALQTATERQGGGIVGFAVLVEAVD